MYKPMILLAALFAPAFAHASSHKINIAPVRQYVESHLVNKRTHTLKLNHKLNVTKPGAGITPAAVEKAVETLRGLTGFNSPVAAGNYVAKMGREKLIITASKSGQMIDGIAYESPGPAQGFVIRTGKSGLVIARGNLDQKTGRITWTRSHNGHSPKTPAERNDAT